MVSITISFIFKLTVIIYCLILHVNAGPTLEAQEFSAIDDELIRILDSPKDEQEWDYMLANITNIIKEIELYMKDMKEDNQEMIQKAYAIYKLGKPQFIDHTFSEPDVQEFGKVTDKQLLDLHVLRDKLDNLWNDFLDILSEKTGETLDYGIHAQYPGYGPDGDHGYNGGEGYGGRGQGYGEGWNGGEGYGEGNDDGYEGGYGEGYGGGYRGGYGGGFRRGRGRGRGRRGGGGGGYGGGDFGPPYR